MKYLWTSKVHLPTSVELLRTATKYLRTSTEYLQTSAENHLTSDANLRSSAQYQPKLSGNQQLFSINVDGTKPPRFLFFFFVLKPWRFLVTFSLNIKSLMTNHSPFITRLWRCRMGVNSFLLFRRWGNYSFFFLKKDLHLCRNGVQSRNFLLVL